MDELPFDIIFNIFSRIPVKLLLQLRCVSKLWCNFIDHPGLANTLRVKQATEEPMILLLSHSTRKSDTLEVKLVKRDRNILKASENPIAKFDFQGCSLEGSCNGLFYFAKYGNHQDQEGVLLLNPLRKKYLQLEANPSLWPYHTKYGLGFDGSIQKYKIVRVFFQELDQTSLSYNLGVEVYTMGTNSWREICNVPPYPIHGKAVFAFGALHWIVHHIFANSDNLKSMIVSFDIGNEEFNLTPHPEFQFKDCKLFHLVDLNGNLGLVDLSSDTNIEIWVLKDYYSKVWVKEYRIDIRPPYGIADNGHAEVIGPWHHGEILLRNYEQNFIFNPRTSVLRCCIQALNPYATIHSHIASLISITNL